MKNKKALYDKLLELYDNQQMITHDKKMVIDMCATSTAYELIYMSDDEDPVPKTAKNLKTRNWLERFAELDKINIIKNRYENAYFGGLDINRPTDFLKKCR